MKSASLHHIPGAVAFTDANRWVKLHVIWLSSHETCMSGVREKSLICHVKKNSGFIVCVAIQFFRFSEISLSHGPRYGHR